MNENKKRKFNPNGFAYTAKEASHLTECCQCGTLNDEMCMTCEICGHNIQKCKTNNGECTLTIYRGNKR